MPDKFEYSEYVLIVLNSEEPFSFSSIFSFFSELSDIDNDLVWVLMIIFLLECIGLLSAIIVLVWYDILVVLI